jgi:hypothetical protein
MPILVATEREVVVIDVERGTSASAQGIGDRPTWTHHVVGQKISFSSISRKQSAAVSPR